tara:strand:- start:19768 stop:20805 length:1038 start_codon:yes stop_codon:yes gene_type:complete
MSGGIAQLVAVGAQDAHLVGTPEVSFFRSTYKRHTNFAQTTERQVIQGNVSNNGMSTVRFERKGDMLGYVYLAVHNGTESQKINFGTVIDKVELLIGGQVIDEQTNEFTANVAIDTLAQNMSKSFNGSLYTGAADTNYFYPLRFFFCENYQSALPLVALQYHDVELRITWGASAANYKWDCYANFIYLDTAERSDVANKPVNMLIQQVQRALGSQSKVQELNFNHPVKFLASANTASGGLFSTTNKIKLQINGTDVADYKFAVPNFTDVISYYHTPNTSSNGQGLFIYPFCLDTAKLQPTGTLNFSRLDSARLVSQTDNITDDIYGVNYNILRIQNGMGGLMYAN